MKTFLLWSIGAAVIAGGAAMYLLFGNGPTEDSQVPEEGQVEVTEEQNTPAAPSSGRNTLSSLMARGENLECTVAYAQGDQIETNTQGTYFTSAGKMRGDFLVSSMGEETVSSIILRDGTLYSWSEIEGDAYGMKISLAQLEASKTEGSPAAQQVVPLDASVDYDCKAWTAVDNSIFEPPTDIIFSDFGDIVNQGMEFGTTYEGGAAGTQNQCAACEGLTPSEKNICRQMMSCGE